MSSSQRGFREPSYFVLASLLDGPLHGYGIIKQAERLSGGDLRLAPGTLYGALERLAESGLIESCGAETVSGRPRHYYRLTEQGRTCLLLEARRLAVAAQAVLDRITVDLSGERAVTTSAGERQPVLCGAEGPARVSTVQPSSSDIVRSGLAPQRA